MIRCVYDREPNFPATDQHPDAVRYHIGAYWVDAVGAAPSQAEVDALARPSPLDLSNVDNLERTLKAVALVMRDYCNALQAGTYSPRTIQQLKNDFAAKYQSLG